MEMDYWNMFLLTGSPEMYIEYKCEKQLENEENDSDGQCERPYNKGNRFW